MYLKIAEIEIIVRLTNDSPFRYRLIIGSTIPKLFKSQVCLINS